MLWASTRYSKTMPPKPTDTHERSAMQTLAPRPGAPQAERLLLFNGWPRYPIQATRLWQRHVQWCLGMYKADRWYGTKIRGLRIAGVENPANVDELQARRDRAWRITLTLIRRTQRFGMLMRAYYGDSLREQEDWLKHGEGLLQRMSEWDIHRR